MVSSVVSQQEETTDRPGACQCGAWMFSLRGFSLGDTDRKGSSVKFWTVMSQTQVPCMVSFRQDEHLRLRLRLEKDCGFG